MTPRPTMEPPPIGTRARAATGVTLAALCALGTALGLREITSPDMGFHLATARWILEHGAVPTTDPFTYTVADHAYVDLQWLFQLAAHGLHAAGGTAAIVVGTVLSTLAFVALALVRVRLYQGFVGAGALLLALIFLLGNLWEPRPQLLSWILGSAILIVLEEHARGRGRWLPLLPLLMLTWVNAHSLFVLGLVAIGAFVGGHLARAAASARVAVDRRLVGWSGAALAACLVNPYQLDGLLFPLVQLADLQPDSAYQAPGSGLAEFRSPFTFDDYLVEGELALLQPLLWWQAFALLATLGLLARRRQASPAEWLLFGAFAYVFWSANKNFGYFAMAVFPSAAAGLSALGARLRSTPGPDARGVLAVGLAALVLVLPARNGRIHAQERFPHRAGTGFDGDRLPVAAADFLIEHGIEGRILNTWNDGGYLAWRTRLPVFIYSHGEVMTQGFYSEYVGMLQPGGIGAAIDRFGITIAVVPVEAAPSWLADLRADPAWRQAFVTADRRTAVFLHLSAAADVPALGGPSPDDVLPTRDDATR